MAHPHPRRRTAPGAGSPGAPPEPRRVTPVMRIGDKVVCPPHGVGEVVAIGHSELGGPPEVFFRFRILGSGLSVLVPERKLCTVGLRPVADEQQAAEVLAFLGRRTRNLTGETWNKRHRVCQAKLASGSLVHAAEVLRELLSIRRDKDLSLTEQRLMDLARRLVVTELAVSLGRTETDVAEEIDALYPAPPPKPYRPDPDE